MISRSMVEKKTAINLLEAFAVSVKHYLRDEDGIYYQYVGCKPVLFGLMRTPERTETYIISSSFFLHTPYPLANLPMLISHFRTTRCLWTSPRAP